jgi:hypothetical protein
LAQVFFTQQDPVDPAVGAFNAVVTQLDPAAQLQFMVPPHEVDNPVPHSPE